MDFIERLPKSEGYSVILVIVDRFTKFAHFLPVRHPYTANTIAQLFLDNIVKLHGLPQNIVSDKDIIFVSQFWKQLFKLYKVDLNFTTAYHPQSDGQTERVNQCLEMFLRCSVQDSPKNWKAWLPLAQLWYNSSYHSSLGCSPFKTLYGYEPNLGICPELTTTTSPTVAEVISNREKHCRALKQRLEQVQNRMKIQADRQHSDKQFEVGDQVLLHMQPYTQSSVVNRPYPKLAYKFFGPYKILERIGKVAYKLELPSGSNIHPVFHISQLKSFHPDHTPVFSILPVTTDLQATEAQPASILDRRLVKKGNTVIPQVLLSWTGLPAASVTWEDYYVVKAQFSDAPAWGQAGSSAGGAITPQD